jgi:hypothetical protein
MKRLRLMLRVRVPTAERQALEDQGVALTVEAQGLTGRSGKQEKQ